MGLKLVGHIDLPEHRGHGGFDHADIHAPTNRLYVAHTSNDALDIIDTAHDRYIGSVPALTGVAGALVSHERDLIFTSNRGENTVSMFSPGDEDDAVKIPVGVKPNGLAFAPSRGILIAANVGDPSLAGSHTVSVVSVTRRARIAEIAVPGRTRWAVYDAAQDMFFVNIASPGLIVAIDAAKPTRISREYAVPAAGPHGLELDVSTGRLLCACDASVLIALDTATGHVCGEVPLSGAPDVVFLHSGLARLYVAIGDPGVIDVIDTARMRRIETVATESGTHTLALDRNRQKIFAFLPGSHCAAVFYDAG